jgi:hypothetical protein
LPSDSPNRIASPPLSRIEFFSIGHSQIATTADVYAHLTPAVLERTAARIDGVLSRRKRAASSP